MKTPNDFSNEPISDSKNQTNRDFGKLGLQAGFIALGGISLGGLALVLTEGFALFAGIFLIIPMIILPFLLSLGGLILSIVGTNTASPQKKTAKWGIILNSALLLPLIVFGGSFLPGGGLKDNYLRSMAFSPDGKLLATGWKGEIHILDTETGKRTEKLKGHTDAVTFLDYSPDGKILASTSYDGTVKLWDVATNQELHSFTMDGVLFQSLSFSPDGKILMAAIQGKGITLLDTASYTIIKNISLNNEDQVEQVVSFSPDGRFVIFNNYSDLYVVNTSDFRKPVILPDALGDQLAVSPNNELVVVSSKDLTGGIPPKIQIWSLLNQNNIFSRPVSTQLPSASYVMLAFSSDSKKLAYTTGSYEKGIYFDVLDIETQQVISFEKEGGIAIFPSNILFSPADTQIALDITDYVMMWDTKSLKLLWQYP